MRERHRLARAAGEANVYRIADRRTRAHDDHTSHELPLPLIGVQFGSAGRAAHDHAGLGRDVQVLDGVRYIVTRAQDTMGAASHALINLSCAHIAGLRDGSSLIESALDELMDTGACSIVIPVGNGHRSRCHGTLSVDDEAALRCRVVRDFASPDVMEIWFASNMRDPLVDVSITPLLGACSEWIGVGNVASYTRNDDGDGDGDTLCMIVHGGRGARGDGHMILIAFTSPGDWLVRLRNRANTQVHAMYSCVRHTNVSRVTQPRA